MKKRIVGIGALLLLALLGCGQRRAAAPGASPLPTSVEVRLETAEPAVTPELLAELTESEPEERILARCVSILDELPCLVDLDGDGEPETVDLTPYTMADEYPRWAVTLIADGREKRFETWVPCDGWYDLWVGDLDEDGSYEIFFHGDTASDDYLIYAFRSDLTPIPFEPDERLFRYGKMEQDTVFEGRVSGFEDSHLVVEGTVNMLGTHWGVRNFAIGEDGVIGPMSTVWEFIEEERPLTVKKELTAYRAGVRKDPGEAFILESGTRIWPLASDGCERMWFRTEAGKGGVLLLVPDEEHLWLIDGTPEADFFEYLPYAG